MEFSALQINQLLNGVIDGNADVKVNSLSKIEEGVSGTLSFWQILNMHPIFTPLKQAL